MRVGQRYGFILTKEDCRMRRIWWLCGRSSGSPRGWKKTK